MPAEDVTIRKGAAAAQAAAPAPDSKEQALRAQLDSLRDVAKKRLGKNLDDVTLLAIVKRNETRRNEAETKLEAKQGHETEASREASGSKSALREVAAQKTLATKDARTPEGLSAQDRQAVRSEPKAGPKLPPAASKVPMPEQAGVIAEKLLATLNRTGIPDLKTYAQALKEKPPSTKPVPMGREATPSAVRTATMSLRAQTPAPRTEVNRGGSLTPPLIFADRIPNFEAFMTLMMLQMAKDRAMFEKMDNKLLDLTQQAKTQTLKTMMARKDLQQFRDRSRAMTSFLKAAAMDLPKAMQELGVALKLQGISPEAIKKHEQELKTQIGRGEGQNPIRGRGERLWLSPSERAQLTPEARAGYETSLARMQEAMSPGQYDAWVAGQKELMAHSRSAAPPLETTAPERATTAQQARDAATTERDAALNKRDAAEAKLQAAREPEQRQAAHRELLEAGRALQAAEARLAEASHTAELATHEANLEEAIGRQPGGRLGLPQTERARLSPSVRARYEQTLAAMLGAMSPEERASWREQQRNLRVGTPGSAPQAPADPTHPKTEAQLAAEQARAAGGTVEDAIIGAELAAECAEARATAHEAATQQAAAARAALEAARTTLEAAKARQGATADELGAAGAQVTAAETAVAQADGVVTNAEVRATTAQNAADDAQGFVEVSKESAAAHQAFVAVLTAMSRYQRALALKNRDALAGRVKALGEQIDKMRTDGKEGELRLDKIQEAIAAARELACFDQAISQTGYISEGRAPAERQADEQIPRLPSDRRFGARGMERYNDLKARKAMDADALVRGLDPADKKFGEALIDRVHGADHFMQIEKAMVADEYALATQQTSAYEIIGGVEKQITEGGYLQAIDRIVADSRARLQGSEEQLYNDMRSQKFQAQGMLDQLIQVMAMGRSIR